MNHRANQAILNRVQDDSAVCHDDRATVRRTGITACHSEITTRHSGLDSESHSPEATS